MTYKGHKQITCKVQAIKTTEISIVEPKNIDFNLIKHWDTYATKFKVINENKAILDFLISTYVIYSTSQEKLITHVGLTRFEVGNLQLADPVDPESLIMPEEILLQIYTNSCAHARALLAVELKDTIYNEKFFPPILVPKNSIDQQLVN